MTTKGLISESSRIIIIEDHELIAMALQMILINHFPPTEERKREIIHFSKIKDARAFISHESCDIDFLLLDLSLDDAGPSDCIQLLNTEWKNIPTIIITGETDPSITTQLIRSGVAGVIPKTAGLKIIGLALQLIDAGSSYYPSQWNSVDTERRHTPHLKNVSNEGENSHLLENFHCTLPPQLSRTLNLIERGLSNKEIAKALSISEGTAKNYVSSILAKFGISRRTQLIAKKLHNTKRISNID